MSSDVRRVSDRLRILSEARLAGEVPGHRSRAGAGRAVAQRLADLAAGVEARAASVAPVWRVLPHLPDLAVGDQVAVTGADATAGLGDVQPEDVVWDRAAGPTPAQVSMAAVAAELAATRRLL